MVHMDTTPEYTLSIAGCVKYAPVTNLAFCHSLCLTAKII